MTHRQAPGRGRSPRGVRVHASLPGPERRSRLATVISFLLHALIIYLAIRLTAAVVLPSTARSAMRSRWCSAAAAAAAGRAARRSSTPAVRRRRRRSHRRRRRHRRHRCPPSCRRRRRCRNRCRPAGAGLPTSASTVAAAGTGTGTGGGNGTGTGTGNGSGRARAAAAVTGGGTGGGNGGFPPVNKQMILPPIDGVPKELRGKPVDVTFYRQRRPAPSPTSRWRRRSRTADSRRNSTKPCAAIAFTPGRDAGGEARSPA